MSRAPAIAFVVLCWAAIYLPGLGSLEIKGEEGRRILPAVTMLETGDFLVPHVGSEPYFSKPPLVNWLVAASFKLTGYRNEWTARLPSALCVLAVALAFIIVARASLGANGSLMAALIWMVNFGMIEKGRLIEIEALYVSLLGLAMICWLSWWEQRRSPWLIWIVPSVFLGLGVLAKGPVHLLFFYSVVVAVLYCAGELRKLWQPAHLAGIAVVARNFRGLGLPLLAGDAGSGFRSNLVRAVHRPPWWRRLQAHALAAQSSPRPRVFSAVDIVAAVGSEGELCDVAGNEPVACPELGLRRSVCRCEFAAGIAPPLLDAGFGWGFVAHGDDAVRE